jgi:multimeric flavodoxin WrbA
MKAILLDGSHENDGTGERARAALAAELQDQGWEVEHVLLRERDIGPCAGDFFCWVRTPGTCMLDDDNRTIAAAIVASDLVVYLTPVTFGGYSSALKRMVDHQIQNVSPFFAQVEGETHHQKRYRKNPDLLAVGWLDAPEPRSEAIFRHLVRRNAINFFAERSASGVVFSGQPDEQIQASVRNLLGTLHNGLGSQQVSLPEGGDASTAVAAGSPAGGPELRRALLLVGSPKARKSTSHLLGGYLLERLGAQSTETETIFLHTAVRSPEKTKALLAAVDAAGLVLLAFPLYVDSLPAPVIEALEAIAAHRQDREGTHSQRFAAIANCGFPEAHQNAAALAICETFARQAGFDWAGSLALGGGGGGTDANTPLAEAGGRAVPLRNALDLAAAALAQGQPIPETARALLAKPLVPQWLYRAIGAVVWRLQARRWNAQRSLRREPYTPASREQGS